MWQWWIENVLVVDWYQVERLNNETRLMMHDFWDAWWERRRKGLKPLDYEKYLVEGDDYFEY